MAIHYYCEDVRKPRLKYRLISSWLKSVLYLSKKTPGDISVIFCSDSYLLEINIEYLGHNYYTDIITFNYVEQDIISGDVFISVDRVKDNSREFGVNLESEFLRVISHGILHLLGQDDHDEEEKIAMRKRESEFIDVYRNLSNDGAR